jgi:Flp pilus assembly protein TadG
MGRSPFERIKRRRQTGQSLAEFAIAFPVLFLFVAAIIQFGLIFWSQNTLTQVARDTGRWAATQQECSTTAATDAVVATANDLASTASLFGYSGGWTSPTNVNVVWTIVPPPVTTPPTPPGECPPKGNQQVAFVRITLSYQVPIFFPFLPVSNTLTTSTEFRMEPISK